MARGDAGAEDDAMETSELLHKEPLTLDDLRRAGIVESGRVGYSRTLRALDGHSLAYWLDAGPITFMRRDGFGRKALGEFKRLLADAGLAREAEAWDRRRIPVAIPTGIDDDSATMRLVRALYGAAAAIEIDKADTVWRAWVKIRPGAESGSVYGENSTPEGACSVLVKRLRAEARRRIVKLRLEARELANAANAAKAANDARW